MYENNDFDEFLEIKAEEIREEIPESTDVDNEPEVIVVVPGEQNGPGRTRLGSTMNPEENNRLRDMIGALQTAILLQKEKHG